MKEKRKFLVDSNAFINLANSYYTFQMAPMFWRWAKEQIENERFIILKVVTKEMTSGNDDLEKWIKNLDKNLIFDEGKDEDIIKCYQAVLQHVEKCGYYKPIALRTWSELGKADPWLIATASAKGYVIATNEKRVGNLSNTDTGKGSKAKIPDVADAFTVETMPMIEVLKELKFKFCD